MEVQGKGRSISWLTLVPILIFPLGALAGTTASGTINATLLNKSGISLVFDSNSSGVALGGTGSSAAAVDFGAISAYGPLSSGVTRTGVGPSAFTVQTLFNVNVTASGLASTSYTLSAQLSAAAPTGLTYGVDAVTLSTATQNVQTNATYNTDVQHSLSLGVSTAAPGASGPAVGTPLTATINFTAIAN